MESFEALELLAMFCALVILPAYFFVWMFT